MKFTLIELLIDMELSENEYNELIGDISDMVAERYDGFTTSKYRVLGEDDVVIAVDFGES